MSPLEGGLNRYDVGRNVSLPFIPLFNFDSHMSGETFPMLGEGNGSVQSALMRAGPQSTVTLKVYPHLIHYIKAAKTYPRLSGDIRQDWKSYRRCY